MSAKRYSRDEISTILKDWSAGLTAEQAAKKHKVTIQTLYRWKRQTLPKTADADSKITGMQQKAQTLAELRAENVRLKTIIADLLLEKYSVA